MNEAKVLLATLSFRVSPQGPSRSDHLPNGISPARPRTGKVYCYGWLGKSKLVGFPGDLDKHGNKTIDLYLQAVEVRSEPRPLATTIGASDYRE